MTKKLMTGLLALVALAAMALPAVASASPELTHPTGTTLATGNKITATNVGNTILTSSLGNVECTKALMTGTLTKNSGTAIEGTIETASFKGNEAEEKCSGAFGAVQVTVTSLPWCIRATSAFAADEFQVRGGACTEAAKAITFTLHTGLFGTCTFERAAASPITGTFRTDTAAGNDALLTITNTAFNRTSGFCPSEGKLDMSFTLETDKTTAEPMYIS